MTTVNGVIGVSGGELARYAIFYDSLLHLQTPPSVVVVQTRGSVISENRNGIAEQALKLGAEWVFYLDDDQVLAPDTLGRLLAHLDNPNVDIVSGVYVARQPPFVPHVYDVEDERGWCTFRPFKKGDAGLVEAKATGAGCMLVRTSVFRKMAAPYWRLGQIIPDGWGDDLNFCHRARIEAGARIWADLDVIVGHHMAATVWPVKDADGTWKTLMIYGSQPIAAWPPAERS